MITDETARTAIFWFSLVALVVLLILSLLKGSKEWYALSQPVFDHTFDQQFSGNPNLNTLSGYQDSRLAQIPTDSLLNGDPQFISNPPVTDPLIAHLQPVDPLLLNRQKPTIDLRTGLPILTDDPRPVMDPRFEGGSQPVHFESTMRADPLLLNKQKPTIDLRTGLPANLTDEPEQPIPMVKSRYESPASVSIRNGIRGSDIRALPKVGGSPIKKPLRQPVPIKKPQSPVKKYR